MSRTLRATAESNLCRAQPNLQGAGTRANFTHRILRPGAGFYSRVLRILAQNMPSNIWVEWYASLSMYCWLYLNDPAMKTELNNSVQFSVGFCFIRVYWEVALVYGVLPNPWFEYVWEDCNSKSGACRCNGLHYFSPPLEILRHHHHGRLSDHGAPKAEKETITATHREKWMRKFSLLLILSFESTLEYMIMAKIYPFQWIT